MKYYTGINISVNHIYDIVFSGICLGPWKIYNQMGRTESFSTFSSSFFDNASI